MRRAAHLVRRRRNEPWTLLLEPQRLQEELAPKDEVNHEGRDASANQIMGCGGYPLGRDWLASWLGEAVWRHDDGVSTANPPIVPPADYSLSAAMIGLVENEIKEGLKQRGSEPNFAQFVSYAGRMLDSTAGRAGWSELSGNCRLGWYEKLYREPLKAMTEGEQFTRELHQAALSDHSGVEQALEMAAQKLGLKMTQGRSSTQAASPKDALDVVKQAVTEARVASLAALAPAYARRTQ